MKQQGVSLRFSLHSDQGGKTPGETFLYKLLKCLLRFGNAPLTDRRGTVLLLISLRSAVRCRGAPSGGVDWQYRGIHHHYISDHRDLLS